MGLKWSRLNFWVICVTIYRKAGRRNGTQLNMLDRESTTYLQIGVAVLLHSEILLDVVVDGASSCLFGRGTPFRFGPGITVEETDARCPRGRSLVRFVHEEGRLR